MAGVPALVRLLSIPANVEILAVLESAPSYPRAIAARLGRSEGRVQKHLAQLQAAGLVKASWRHTDRTFKEYRLAAHHVRIDLEDGVVARLE